MRHSPLLSKQRQIPETGGQEASCLLDPLVHNVGPRKKQVLLHTWRLKHSASGMPMLRTDHSTQTGGQASLARGGSGTWSAPWSREAYLPLVPKSVSLYRCAGGARNRHVFRWLPHFALKVVCPSSKHTEFPQKEEHIFLSTRAALQVAPQGVASAQRSHLFSNLSAQSRRFIPVCTKAWMAIK